MTLHLLLDLVYHLAALAMVLIAFRHADRAEAERDDAQRALQQAETELRHTRAKLAEGAPQYLTLDTLIKGRS